MRSTPLQDAAEIATQAVEWFTGPNLVSMGIAAVALLVAIASAWTNWRAAAPRLSTRFEPDLALAQGHIKVVITNDGKDWVDNVRIKWKFDPRHYHAPKDEWSCDALLPGNSFTAYLRYVGPSDFAGYDRMPEAVVERYRAELAESRNKKRRLGKASFSRQTSLPFMRHRQRVMLPPVPTDVHLQLNDIFGDPYASLGA